MLRVFSLILLISWNVRAAQANYFTSPSNNGLNLVLFSQELYVHPERSSAEGIDWQDSLVFALRTLTNQSSVVICSKSLDYWWKIELWDANGKLVPKTRSGTSVGKYFERPQIPRTEIRRLEVDSSQEPTMTLVRPSDLFRISKPGKYIMSITLKVIQLVDTGAALPEPKTILLGPVKIPVRRMED